MIAPLSAKDRLNRKLRLGDFVLYVKGINSSSIIYIGKIIEISSTRIKIIAVGESFFNKNVFSNLEIKRPAPGNCILFPYEEVPHKLIEAVLIQETKL